MSHKEAKISSHAEPRSNNQSKKMSQAAAPPQIEIHEPETAVGTELLPFERTLALVKPNATNKLKAIEAAIKRSGLAILKRRRLHLRQEQAADFYFRTLDAEDNKYFRIYRDMEPGDVRLGEVPDPVEDCPLAEYVEFMTGGPTVVMILAGRGAVDRWRRLMGPESPRAARLVSPDSLRARFGGETALRNGVYGSGSEEEAEREIRFFFPAVGSERDAREAESGEYLSRNVNPVLLKGLIHLCRQKPENPLVWLADWLLANNPNAK